MKHEIMVGVGTVGSIVASFFGGWTASMSTLLLFMLFDYVTGLVVAGVFHKSKKTDTGTLESRAGFKGLLKKGMVMVLVLVAYRLDLAMGTGGTYIRDAVCIAFVLNETISIIENAGLMGVKIPAVLENAIDLLKKKKEEEVNSTLK